MNNTPQRKNLKVKPENYLKKQETDKLFYFLKCYEESLLAELLEFPTFIQDIINMKSGIYNNTVKLKDILRRMSEFEENIEEDENGETVKMGNLSMVQRNDLLKSLEDQKNFYFYNDNKILPFIFYENIIDNPYYQFRKASKEYIESYSSYKQFFFSEITRCDFAQEVFLEEVDVLNSIIEHWGMIVRTHQGFIEDLGIPYDEFVRLTHRKERNELSWALYSDLIECSLEKAQYLYDKYFEIDKVLKAYSKTFPFGYETAVEYMDNINGLMQLILKTKNIIFENNMGLAQAATGDSINKLINPQSIPREDLYHEALFGLRKAINKFDLSNGAAFSTYAMNWIMQAIQRCPETYQCIKLPVYTQSLVKEISIYKSHCKETGEPYTTENIQKYLAEKGKKVSLKKIEEVIIGANTIISLNAPVSGDSENRTFEDYIPDTSISSLEDIASDHFDIKEKLEEALSKLNNPTYERLLRQFWGIGYDNANREETIKSLAQKENISQQSIKNLTSQAFEELANIIKRDYAYLEDELHM